MTVTSESPAITAPRISRERFVAVLEGAGSPWAAKAGELYDLIAGNGHDPGFWLAVAGREHSFGSNRNSVLWRNETHSWTNARSVRAPGLQTSIITDVLRGGPYVRYASVEDSLIDGMYRLTDPAYRYAREGRTTIGQVLAIWTESDAEAYIAYVVEMLNRWRGSPPSENAPIRGLVDVRADLSRRLAPQGGVVAGPFASVPVAKKRGIVIHYNGPEVDRSRPTLEVLKAQARYHVDRNWASAGSPPVYGDGLMYHVAVGANGTKYWCRNLDAVLWHCGNTHWNEHALSVQVPLGGGQRATGQQLQSLREIIEDWCRHTGTTPAEVVGHCELQATSCPGTLMQDLVLPYREGTVTVSDGAWFNETGKYIGGAFWEFWQSRGGLPIFGYPLTNELTEGGRTVQYFERAVMEWHPDNTPEHRVLLRRLGAEALASITV